MTYHMIPLIENSNQFFSLICQYWATRRFCEGTTAQPGDFARPRKIARFVRERYPVSVIFLCAQFFLCNFFLYLTYRLETYGAHTLYLNQHSRQSTSIYLYYFFCSIRLNESSREMREIARGDATQRSLFELSSVDRGENDELSLNSVLHKNYNS